MSRAPHTATSTPSLAPSSSAPSTTASRRAATAAAAAASTPTHPSTHTDSASILWAEMQHKLGEVELSNNSALFFGSAHAGALENLRAAQIALAQAWVQAPDDPEDAGTGGGGGGGGGGIGGGVGGMEVARRRRERNDAHFDAVQRGVLDVGVCLEDVAAAMRGVERESRGMWDTASSEDELQQPQPQQ